MPVNVLWHFVAHENVATFISLPRLIPESAVGVNSSVLEVKLLVAKHTGIEIGVKSDLTNLDLLTELLVRELIDEVLFERLGLGKHTENGVACFYTSLQLIIPGILGSIRFQAPLAFGIVVADEAKRVGHSIFSDSDSIKLSTIVLKLIHGRDTNGKGSSGAFN